MGADRKCKMRGVLNGKRREEDEYSDFTTRKSKRF